METMQPTLKNGRNVWDQINMPKVEFQERVKRLRKEMRKEGIDVLLLYGNANEYWNPCYVSNFIMGLSTRGAMVAIPKREEIVLMFEGPARGLPSVKNTTWVEEVRPCGDVSKECVKYLEEKRLTPSTLGLVGLRQLMPNDQLQFLSDSLNQCKMVDLDHLLREMRMVKSQRETDQIRRASRILTHAFDFITGAPFADMNERVLEARVCREVRLEGAEDFRMLIAKPKETKWAFRPPEEVQILPGDTVIIYLAIEFERYWSEGIRTFNAKNSSFVEVKSEKFGSLYERVVDCIQPREKLSQFYKKTLHEIQKSKADAIWEYGIGQGIGLSLQEFPVINKEEKSVFKESMCLTLRLAIKDREMGTIMVGNTIHVSKNGPEVLSK